jgi:hypothetical protein
VGYSAKKHEKFCRASQEKSVFIYYPAKEVVFHDNQPLFSGMQAKIFAHMLNSHIKEARTDFCHQEFTKDNRFIVHPKNTGFPTNLKRIEQKLKLTDAPIKIVRTEKGRFSFTATSKIVLRMHSSTDAQLTPG